MPTISCEHFKKHFGQMAGMDLMRCKMCDREEKSLFKVNFRKRGKIKIRRDCLEQTEFGSELLIRKLLLK